jgi:hypothetical protein
VTHPRRAFIGLVVFLLTSSAATFGQRQQPSRLVVTNHAGVVVTVSAFVGKTWQHRGRLQPGASVPLTGVSNGDRFRAEWQGGSSEKVVQLRHDKAYGGLQDTWIVK